MSLFKARRNFLKNTMVVGGAALVGSQVGAQALCQKTPAQALGPFYPGERAFDQNFDLTWVPGSSVRALGQVVYVKGRVLDENCQPLANANVEIWQACQSGRYNHDQDPNEAPLDPNFRYWAEVFTNSRGEYTFKTIIPGAYPASPGWVRPPHIHYRISKLGYHELITQMYFAGEALNETDRILQQVPRAERSALVVPFSPVDSTLEPGSLIGEFNITLRKV